MIEKSNNTPALRQPISSSVGITVVLAMTVFITSLAISSVNIILPRLVGALGSNFEDVQWVTIAYMLSLTPTLIITGQLSDTLGRKPLFLLGLIIFTLSAGMCGLIDNLGLLITVRAIQGVGGAILITLTLAIISDVFPKRNVAAVIGLTGSMSALGTALGPVISGILADLINWQSVFLIKAFLGGVTFLIAYKYLPDIPNPHRAQTKKKFSVDYLGIVLLFLSIVIYTFSLKEAVHIVSAKSVGLFFVSMLFLWLFIHAEKQAQSPLINFTLFSNGERVTSLFSNLMVSTVAMTSMVIGPFYLSIALQLSLVHIGFVIAVSPCAVAITSSIVGRFATVDKLTDIILTGLFIMVLGTFCMTQLTVEHGLVGYMACTVVISIGYAIFLSANNTFTMINAPANSRGSVSGILNLSRMLGLLTGASLMSSIFASNSGMTSTSVTHSQLIEAGLHSAYYLACLLLVVAILAQITARITTPITTRH
ncbi:MFS transporter [Flocculibacter collagenilyticus]|uniref:MFS transporter n=1 Tax=Flocculibacter collagenilyticus TaxID=2744479 RepID=UPI0018F3AD34|nr:MFS transporter [Flocculibacter collagenilyticus]